MPGRAAFGVHDVVNENMAGAARVAIAERGRVPAEYALLATGGAGPVHAWHVARKLGVKRVVCPPGAGAGSTIGMLMAPARVDRVASFTMALAGADLTPPRAIFAGLERNRSTCCASPAPTSRVAPSGAWPTCAISARAARSPWRCRSRSTEAGVQDGLRGRLQGAVRAHAAGRRHPVRGAAAVGQRADAGHGGTLELPRHAQPTALKGTRPVFFPDDGKTLPTQVWDRYALAPGVSIDGPAVFEEDESTFIVGPGAKARLLADGSILAEAN